MRWRFDMLGIGVSDIEMFTNCQLYTKRWIYLIRRRTQRIRDVLNENKNKGTNHSIQSANTWQRSQKLHYLLAFKGNWPRVASQLSVPCCISNYFPTCTSSSFVATISFDSLISLCLNIKHTSCHFVTIQVRVRKGSSAMSQKIYLSI